jgi:hypothetical protein
MKRETLTFLTTPKHRAHRVLFDTDTPFTPKVVKSKKLFKRQPKHKNSSPEA